MVLQALLNVDQERWLEDSFPPSERVRKILRLWFSQRTFSARSILATETAETVTEFGVIDQRGF